LIKDTLCIGLRVNLDRIADLLGFALALGQVAPVDLSSARIGGGQNELEHRQHGGTHQRHHHEAGGGKSDPQQDVDGGERDHWHRPTLAERDGLWALATIVGVSQAQPAPGRVRFRARRPAALVLPLAAITEVAGVLSLLNGATIGWFVCAAPVVALITTGLVLRPSIELTREGVVQRQYPFSTLTRWEVIDGVGLTRAGNRLVLGYRLVAGVPPPRRQPAAALLRAAQRPFDGGYFVDSLSADPEEILAIVEAYRHSPELREALPAARR
jgi:hypothetical protein